MRISDWSSDVCSSDLEDLPSQDELAAAANAAAARAMAEAKADTPESRNYVNVERGFSITFPEGWQKDAASSNADGVVYQDPGAGADVRIFWQKKEGDQTLQQIVETVSEGSEGRSEEHTSELQSLMRISYAVFCLTKKIQNI